jgi:hypothetical protein
MVKNEKPAPAMHGQKAGNNASFNFFYILYGKNCPTSILEQIMSEPITTMGYAFAKAKQHQLHRQRLGVK